MPQFVTAILLSTVRLASRLAGIAFASMIPFVLAAFVEMSVNPATWSVLTRLVVALLWLALMVGLVLANTPRSLGNSPS